MTINAGSFVFVGSGTTASEIVLAPQESIELICYNNETDDRKELIVIGKSLLSEETPDAGE